MLRHTLVTITGKTLSKSAQILNLGSGSTWPGHLALKANKHFVKQALKDSKIKVILVVGTNGKTTTSKLIQTILEKNGKTVLLNHSGANLLNGIASTLIDHANLKGQLTHDFAIFEIDENTLPQILNELTPDYIVMLNLFRDQLDRYGEVRTIASHWSDALKKLGEKTTLILNADDPEIARFGSIGDSKPLYFGLDDKSISKKTHEHAVDSIYCPKCGERLTYKAIYLSHLGDWKCGKCGYKRPNPDLTKVYESSLTGVYNQYNILASMLLAQTIGIDDEGIKTALKEFTPAFGRQETLTYKEKKIQIFLSKNPTGFNESLRTIVQEKGKHVLFVLNDRIPDGTDVSWIWDIELEEYMDKFESITISGDRCYDMGLRYKYAQEFEISNLKFKIEENLNRAITTALENTSKTDTLYILPTYSAMLEVRKILTGKKIL